MTPYKMCMMALADRLTKITRFQWMQRFCNRMQLRIAANSDEKLPELPSTFWAVLN